jgi:hypothetical protein
MRNMINILLLLLEAGGLQVKSHHEPFIRNVRTYKRSSKTFF